MTPRQMNRADAGGCVLRWGKGSAFWSPVRVLCLFLAGCFEPPSGGQISPIATRARHSTDMMGSNPAALRPSFQAPSAPQTTTTTSTAQSREQQINSTRSFKKKHDTKREKEKEIHITTRRRNQSHLKNLKNSNPFAGIWNMIGWEEDREILF